MNNLIKKGEKMRLRKFKIKNFRGYSEEITIDINNFTAFVGKNDIGKSTILEAMNIFFNGGDSKQLIPLDKDDLNKKCVSNGDTEIIFSACFDDLPDEIKIDSTYLTNLQNEYLLNKDSCLEIVKRYPNASAKEKVFIKAMHPTNLNCSELLSKKNNELKKIITDNNIECENKSVNSIMRKAIWNHYDTDLQLDEIELDVSKGDTDGIKSIWERLKDYLPLYSLFQADRQNSDTDDEVQDPLQTAVKQIISTNDIQNKLKEISDTVLNELQKIASDTLLKLKDINETLANTLEPKIPEVESLKWADVFKKVSIASNNDIPINKRGSGVKRLILLSFFQAEAEKKKTEFNNRSIIYAIEEPETSQHYEHQRILVEALKKLSSNSDTQVMITTHSSVIVKEMDFDKIRIIDEENELKVIKLVKNHYLPSPSLNEINYLVFGEISCEYHDELFGYLETKARDIDNVSGQKSFDPWLKAKLSTYPCKDYIDNRNGKTINYTLSMYIRNRVHHPENDKNEIETPEEIKESIESMHEVIKLVG